MGLIEFFSDPESPLLSPTQSPMNAKWEISAKMAAITRRNCFSLEQETVFMFGILTAPSDVLAGCVFRVSATARPSLEYATDRLEERTR